MPVTAMSAQAAKQDASSEVQQDFPDTISDASIAFARALSDPEQKTRTRALKRLRKYITSRSKPFTELEMMKLWKGLFYCMWLCDMALVQEELARRLASLMKTFKTKQDVIMYWQCFFKTMGREWLKIDYLRVDKFYNLITQILQDTFIFMEAKQWDEEYVNKFSGILSSVVFQADLVKYPVGVGHHLCDILFRELMEVQGAVPTTVFHTLLDPFLVAAARHKSESMRTRIDLEIFQNITPEYAEVFGPKFQIDWTQLAERVHQLAVAPHTTGDGKKLLLAFESTLRGYIAAEAEAQNGQDGAEKSKKKKKKAVENTRKRKHVETETAADDDDDEVPQLVVPPPASDSKKKKKKQQQQQQQQQQQSQQAQVVPQAAQQVKAASPKKQAAPVIAPSAAVAPVTTTASAPANGQQATPKRKKLAAQETQAVEPVASAVASQPSQPSQPASVPATPVRKQEANGNKSTAPTVPTPSGKAKPSPAKPVAPATPTVAAPAPQSSAAPEVPETPKSAPRILKVKQSPQKVVTPKLASQAGWVANKLTKAEALANEEATPNRRRLSVTWGRDQSLEFEKQRPPSAVGERRRRQSIK